MASPAFRSNARLRTKTGCFKCRQSRVKCDEARPICTRCRDIGSDCDWPSQQDVVDRRHRRRKQPVRGQSGVLEHECQNDLEQSLFSHFASRLLPALVRKDASNAPAVLDYMLAMSQSSEALKASMLACAAMNVAQNNPDYIDVALNFYVRAVEDFRRMLEHEAQLADSDGLLATISCLLIFETSRSDSNPTFTFHLKAMARILSGRSVGPDTIFTMSFAFHKLMAESFLYHGSLLMIFEPEFDPFTDDMIGAVLQYYLGITSLTSSSRSDPSLVLNAPYNLHFLIIDVTRLAKRRRKSGFPAVQQAWIRLSERLNRLTEAANKNFDSTRAHSVHLLALRACLDLSALGTGRENNAAQLELTIKKAMEVVLFTDFDNMFTLHALWPLAILGSMAIIQDEIRTIKVAVKEIARSKRQNSVQAVISRLETIWSCCSTNHEAATQTRIKGFYTLLDAAQAPLQT